MKKHRVDSGSVFVPTKLIISTPPETDPESSLCFCTVFHRMKNIWSILGRLSYQRNFVISTPPPKNDPESSLCFYAGISASAVCQVHIRTSLGVLVVPKCQPASTEKYVVVKSLISISAAHKHVAKTIGKLARTNKF